jgi:hypothetical protein
MCRTWRFARLAYAVEFAFVVVAQADVFHCTSRHSGAGNRALRRSLVVFLRFITLYITPVIYLYLKAAARGVGSIRLWHHRRVAPVACELKHCVVGLVYCSRRVPR